MGIGKGVARRGLKLRRDLSQLLIDSSMSPESPAASGAHRSGTPSAREPSMMHEIANVAAQAAFVEAHSSWLQIPSTCRTSAPRRDNWLAPLALDQDTEPSGSPVPTLSPLPRSPPKPSTYPIDSLGRRFRGALLRRGEEGYGEGRRLWNGAIDAIRRWWRAAPVRTASPPRCPLPGSGTGP